MSHLARGVITERSVARNDCGPCATATVLTYLQMERITSRQAAEEMRVWRIPGVGATLPWGIPATLHKHGFPTAGGWFGTLNVIKDQIDADRPVIVLVRPTDLKGIPFLSLHYRVVVGYNDNENAPGGGELFFSCSALPPAPTSDVNHPGNLALSYALFRRQWLTWISINWYVAAYPGKAGLG